MEAELQKSFKLAEDVQWLHIGGHGAFTVPLDGKLAVVDSSVDSAFLVGEGETHTSNNTTWKVESGELKSAKNEGLVQMIQTEKKIAKYLSQKTFENVTPIEAYHRTNTGTRRSEGLVVLFR